VYVIVKEGSVNAKKLAECRHGEERRVKPEEESTSDVN